MSPEQLCQFCPAAERFHVPLLATFERFQISTPVRQAAFLAQVAHESAGFRRLEENLNYSAQGLKATWPHRFDVEKAALLHRKPQQIANYVYAGRLGNGPESSGDGWRFRGRGLIQITGRNNYREVSEALFLSAHRLLDEPELLTQPDCAAKSAGYFWQSRGLNLLADQGNFRQITYRINGGYHGMDARDALHAKVLNALECFA